MLSPYKIEVVDNEDLSLTEVSSCIDLSTVEVTAPGNSVHFVEAFPPEHPAVVEVSDLTEIEVSED